MKKLIPNGPYPKISPPHTARGPGPLGSRAGLESRRPCAHPIHPKVPVSHPRLKPRFRPTPRQRRSPLPFLPAGESDARHAATPRAPAALTALGRKRSAARPAARQPRTTPRSSKETRPPLTRSSPPCKSRTITKFLRLIASPLAKSVLGEYLLLRVVPH